MEKLTTAAAAEAFKNARVGAKLNLGENLYIRVSKPGSEGTFLFRVCLHGRDTMHVIGRVPGMTFDEAQLIAERRQSEVAAARLENSQNTFRERLSSAKQGPAFQKAGALGRSRSELEGARFVGFRSLEDAGKFRNSLLENRRVMLPELYLWLLLTLLVPSRSAKLLNAMWCDVDDANGVWTVQTPKFRQGSVKALGHPHIAVLSDGAREALRELRAISGLSGYLFPALRGMPASSMRSLVRNIVQGIWPQYHVEPSEFGAFFEQVAGKYSLFHPDLVRDMLAHRPWNSVDYNPGTYRTQLIALASWWGDTLNWFAFGSTSAWWPATLHYPGQAKSRWGPMP